MPRTPPTLFTKLTSGSFKGPSSEGLISISPALALLLTKFGLLITGIENSALTLYSTKNNESGTGLTRILRGSQEGKIIIKSKK